MAIEKVKRVKFEYTPDELNTAVYQVQLAEGSWQKAKDDYEILEDSSKDVLAQIKNKIRLEGVDSDAGAETQARASEDFKTFKLGLYEAKRALGIASLDYKHAMRCLDAITSGLAYRRELVKRNVEQA